MCGEISEGDTKFLHAMKLMALEDLDFSEFKMSKYQKLSQSLLVPLIILTIFISSDDHEP